EGRALLRAALASTDPADQGRTPALLQASWLASVQGEHDEALARALEALALERALGRPLLLARVLDMVASAYQAHGDLRAACAARAEAVALARALGQPLDLAVLVHNLAYTLIQAGRLDEAAELIEEALAAYREHARYPVPPEWLHTAGTLALARGDS